MNLVLLPQPSEIVSGFYDGNNSFKLRFIPQKTGTTFNVGCKP